MYSFKSAAWVLGYSVMSIGVAPATGQLVEENVLLLYNSKDAESSAIRTAYKQAHPNVIEFDLDIEYALWPPQSVHNSDYCPQCTIVTCDDCGGIEGPCCTCPTVAEGVNQSFKAMNKYFITAANVRGRSEDTAPRFFGAVCKRVSRTAA